MIKRISVISDFFTKSFSEFESLENEFVISSLCPEIKTNGRVVFEIEFKDKIKSVRTSAYQWSDDFENYIAGPLSPKIIRLKSGQLVQANCVLGFWEINAKKNKLLWKFNPPKSCLIVDYKGEKNSRTLEEYFNTTLKEIKLLFPKESALEWSRSTIPFSAVACFTDHCDFDTIKNLKTLRELFHKTGITTTKGFFLNHFSKREDNASWENNADELIKWMDDGHELAYHSLSQSLKRDDESFSDFQNFVAPANTVSTWIDHGFQPYNLSLWSKSGRSRNEFFDKMRSQSVNVFWNYLDSGTSAEGVLNQLSLGQFTLQSYFKGISQLSFKERVKLGIKNVFFHYYADEQLVEDYKALASKFKATLKKKSPQTLLNLCKSVSAVFFPLLKVALSWSKAKKRIYPLAKYNPIFFTLKEGQSKFVVFQTLEMVDFVTSLSIKNLDLFCEEKGFFVAHTYFSVNLSYHEGRVLLSDDEVNAATLANFQYLGELIKERKIWNPTLFELKEYLKDIEELEFFINKEGEVFTSANQYHIRPVT